VRFVVDKMANIPPCFLLIHSTHITLKVGDRPDQPAPYCTFHHELGLYCGLVLIVSVSGMIIQQKLFS
jgi:hypothetical protein